MAIIDKYRTKDKPTLDDLKYRLKREFYRLVSELSFCDELLGRTYLLAPDADRDDMAVQSVWIILESCKECAISATARLWEKSSDTISFSNINSKLIDLWADCEQLPDDYLGAWAAAYDGLSQSKYRESLLVLRDEEFGHNIIDSVKRTGSLRLFDAGAVGAREFDITNGEALEFCKNSARLLFQAIAPWTEPNPCLIPIWSRRFDIKFEHHRRIHGALLEKLR